MSASSGISRERAIDLCGQAFAVAKSAHEKTEAMEKLVKEARAARDAGTEKGEAVTNAEKKLCEAYAEGSEQLKAAMRNVIKAASILQAEYRDNPGEFTVEKQEWLLLLADAVIELNPALVDLRQQKVPVRTDSLSFHKPLPLNLIDVLSRFGSRLVEYRKIIREQGGALFDKQIISNPEKIHEAITEEISLDHSSVQAPEDFCSARLVQARAVVENPDNEKEVEDLVARAVLEYTEETVTEERPAFKNAIEAHKSELKEYINYAEIVSNEIRDIFQGYKAGTITRVKAVELFREIADTRLQVFYQEFMRLNHGNTNSLFRVLVKGLFHATNGFREATLNEIAYEPAESEKATVLGIEVSVAKKKSKKDEDRVLHRQVMVDGNQGALFAVFDGHGGKKCADFLVGTFVDCFQFNLEEMKKKFDPEKEGWTEQQLKEARIFNAFKQTFIQLSHLWIRNNRTEKDGEVAISDPSGSTAVVALWIDNELWVANVGDSRAVLKHGDELIQLSKDQKPTDRGLLPGIYNRGGELFTRRGGVVTIGSSSGNVATGRSIGDAPVRGINPRPKVKCLPVSEDMLGSGNLQLVMASDGLFDVLGSHEIAEIGEKSEKSLDQALLDEAVHRETRDDTTVLVANLRAIQTGDDTIPAAAAPSS